MPCVPAGLMFAASVERKWYSLKDTYMCQPFFDKHAYPGVSLRCGLRRPGTTHAPPAPTTASKRPSRRRSPLHGVGAPAVRGGGGLRRASMLTMGARTGRLRERARTRGTGSW